MLRVVTIIIRTQREDTGPLHPLMLPDEWSLSTILNKVEVISNKYLEEVGAIEYSPENITYSQFMLKSGS